MHRSWSRAHLRAWLLWLPLAGALPACSGKNPANADGEATDPITAGENDPNVVSGGQSGGEGEGNNLPGADMPCACLFSPVLGTVVELSGGCARVEVTNTFDIFPEVAVEAVLGGVLYAACSGSDPFQVGDDIFFQFWPGEGEPCAERRACQSTCNPATPECGKACATETAAACAEATARSHQTGRFAALSATSAGVTFHFAGQSRTASIDELLSLTCWEDQQRQLDEYEQTRAAMPAPATASYASTSNGEQMAMMPAPPPSPEECFSAR